jgi:glycosyltransferase involved in cell wall biosynthesis
MIRTPEQCPYRKRLAPGREADGFRCDLASQTAALGPDRAFRVPPDACEACCAAAPPAPGHLNPVVASLVYAAGARAMAEGNASAQEVQEAVRAQRLCFDLLETVHEGSPGTGERTDGRGGAKPVEIGFEAAGPRRRRSHLAWAVGLLTAPRPESTVHRALRSLKAAGFERVHVFAEPGSWIPEQFRDLPVTMHGETLGNLGNFYACIVGLYMTQPLADCYAVFQDDVEVARGLRPWCDRQFWPLDAGLVSLFTSRLHGARTVGWRVLKLGRYRTFGAQAFVFRRDVLEQFLTDRRALGFRARRRHGSDAVVGEWAARHGVGIAYHTPSLVQHVGTAAAIAGPGHGLGRAGVAEAVGSVGQIRAWTPPREQLGAVGLIGWNTASGLGYQNRDLAAHLPIRKWLVPRHSRFATLPDPPLECRIEHVPQELAPDRLRAWLRGLDWVLFFELPYVDRFAQLAREHDVSVACVANWEWTDLELDWVNYVDLMICPTQYTFDLLRGWKRRFGFAWDVVHVPWPIDTDRFRFRPRDRCRRFLFVNGTGGCPARRPDGSLTEYRRKGCGVLFEAAAMIPHVPFVVYSQIDEIGQPPGNVELRKAPRQNERLYEEGDVCVQPSHWEGLGLQMLECQSAGLPLITTDAPPMNEHRPLRSIPVCGTEVVSVYGKHAITSHLIDPADLAGILEALHGTDVAEASRQARRFVVAEHSWEQARRLLEARLTR